MRRGFRFVVASGWQRIRLLWSAAFSDLGIKKAVGGRLRIYNLTIKRSLQLQRRAKIDTILCSTLHLSNEKFYNAQPQFTNININNRTRATLD